MAAPTMPAINAPTRINLVPLMAPRMVPYGEPGRKRRKYRFRPNGTSRAALAGSPSAPRPSSSIGFSGVLELAILSVVHGVRARQEGFSPMSRRLATVTRTLTIIVSLAIAVALAIIDRSQYILYVLGATAAVLWIVNRLGPKLEGDAYDRALRVQASAVGVAGVVALICVPLVLSGQLDARNRSVSVVLCLLIAGCCAFLVIQAASFLRAGGGGLEATELWKAEGLDAVRARNQREPKRLDRIIDELGALVSAGLRGRYSCSVCGNRYYTRRGLTDHHAESHGGDPESAREPS